jgi:hypothetical protein
MMHFDDFIHRVLPAIGPLALFIAVACQRQNNRSLLLLVSVLSFAVTFFAAAVSAWLGLRFDESHELPPWYNQLYWWLTQWVVPLGHAVGGLAILAFSVRNRAGRGGA